MDWMYDGDKGEWVNGHYSAVITEYGWTVTYKGEVIATHLSNMAEVDETKLRCDTVIAAQKEQSETRRYVCCYRRRELGHSQHCPFADFAVAAMLRRARRDVIQYFSKRMDSLETLYDEVLRFAMTTTLTKISAYRAYSDAVAISESAAIIASKEPVLTDRCEALISEIDELTIRLYIYLHTTSVH